MRRFAILLALLTILTFGSSAWAQSAQSPSPEAKAAARTLGVSGLEALQASDYEKALDSFDRALQLFDFPTLRLGRARALVGLGRFVEASEEYRTILTAELDDTEQMRGVQRDAERELTQIQAKIGHVQLAVTPQDASVELDGKAIASAMVGLAIPLDPGEHDLQVSRDGYTPSQQRVTVASGATEVVSVDLVAVPVADPGPIAVPGAHASGEPEPTNEPDRVADDASTQVREGGISTATYVAGGATLVLTGAAVLTGVFALDRRSDFDSVNTPDVSHDQKQTKHDDAVTMSWISTGLTAGAVLGAALTTYLFFDSDDEEVVASLRTDGRSALLMASGRF